MEGFMHWRIRPWMRRMITRLLAIVPAILIIGVRGNGSVTDLVNLSQVVLCSAIAVRHVSAAAFHQLAQTDGQVAERLVPVDPGWGSAILITAMDIYSLPESLKEAWQVIAGG